MIKGISPAGKYISIFNGQPAATYVNGYSGLQGVGNVRYNTSNQALEVFDGNNWMTLSMPFASVGLSPEAEMLLDWAKDKYWKERELKELAEKNKAVKIALDNVEQAQQQLNVIANLARDYEQTTS